MNVGDRRSVHAYAKVGAETEASPSHFGDRVSLGRLGRRPRSRDEYGDRPVAGVDRLLLEVAGRPGGSPLLRQMVATRCLRPPENGDRTLPQRLGPGRGAGRSCGHHVEGSGYREIGRYWRLRAPATNFPFLLIDVFSERRMPFFHCLPGPSESEGSRRYSCGRSSDADDDRGWCRCRAADVNL
jgi:hypothetical protein